jgi:hypothetical protein
MKNITLYGLLFVLLLSSCNKGVYITIENKKYNYGKNTVVRIGRQEGTPIHYGFDIKTFKKSNDDSSFFLIDAGRANIPLAAGDYSFAQNDRINFSASGIEFNNSNGKQYANGWDDYYGPTFVITSLTKKRIKGYFKSRLVDTKADTTKPSNTIMVEGRFNVSLKNAKHY